MPEEPWERKYFRDKALLFWSTKPIGFKISCEDMLMHLFGEKGETEAEKYFLKDKCRKVVSYIRKKTGLHIYSIKLPRKKMRFFILLKDKKHFDQVINELKCMEDGFHSKRKTLELEKFNDLIQEYRQDRLKDSMK